MNKFILKNKTIIIFIAIVTILIVGAIASTKTVYLSNTQKTPQYQQEEIICQSETSSECLFAGCNGLF